MKPLTFTNTKIKVDTWSSDLHTTHSQGYAYRHPSHGVFLCGEGCPYIGWSLVDQDVTGTLESWCAENFGASNLEPTQYDIGTAIHSVWRPGIFSAAALSEALSFSDEEIFRASQALRLLVSRLDEILLFVEPDIKFLNTYGHKQRDLLIAACTEVENYFQHYMQLAAATPLSGKYFNIKDYVRLEPKLFLGDFKIEMHPYPVVGVIAPFSNWSSTNFVLPWYDAYNKTKHHRDDEFHRATVNNCIQAVAACLVLFSVRFGPTWWQSNFVNSPIPDAYRLFRQVQYTGDPRAVYVPDIEFPSAGSGRIWGNLSGQVRPWKTLPFTL